MDAFALLPWWVNALLALVAYALLKYVVPELQSANAFTKMFIKLGPTFAPIAALIFGGAGILSLVKSVGTRRRTKPLFDDLVVLPWWVTCGTAVVLYVVLRYVVPAFQYDPGLSKALASIAPTFAPFVALLLFVAAAVSAWNQLRNRSLFDSNREIRAIRDLSWQDFEKYVAEACRRQGFSVRETGGGGADGGIDLVITKEGKDYFVQCKQWKAESVKVTQVRELAGVIKTKGAHGGILITSGRITQEAREFAKDAGIVLIDGEALPGYLQVPQSDLTSANDHIVTCPKCGDSMVRRVARRGKYQGQSFWGCSSYPRCNGKVDIPA